MRMNLAQRLDLAQGVRITLEAILTDTLTEDIDDADALAEMVLDSDRLKVFSQCHPDTLAALRGHTFSIQKEYVRQLLVEAGYGR